MNQLSQIQNEFQAVKGQLEGFQDKYRLETLNKDNIIAGLQEELQQLRGLRELQDMNLSKQVSDLEVRKELQIEHLSQELQHYKDLSFKLNKEIDNLFLERQQLVQKSNEDF